MNDPGLVIQTWHIFLGAIGIIGSIISIIGGYHRIAVLPERQRREEVSKRLYELERKQSLQEQRLEHGNQKFEDVIETIEKLRSELRSDHEKLEGKVDDIQKTLAASIWRAVGEER